MLTKLKRCVISALNKRISNIKSAIVSAGLICLLAALALTHVGLHRDLDEASQAQVVNPWSLDFEALEQLLWQPNFSLLAVLQRGAKILELSSPDELPRLQYLIEKALPSTRGKEVAQILPQYLAYASEEERLKQQLQNPDKTTRLAALQAFEENIKAAQNQYFGNNLAASLFAEHNATQFYFVRRQIINLEAGLSESQRQQRLEEAQQEYRAVLDSL